MAKLSISKKTPTPKRRATPPPRSASAPKTSATKAEVLETLFATQKKLLEAETALQTQAAEYAALNAVLATTQAETERHESAVYESQVDIRVLEGARDAALARLTEARAEVLDLTRILAETQAARAEMERQITELSVQLSQAEQTAKTQAETLQSELSAARTDTRQVEALERTAARQEQQLAAQAREITEMARLLAEAEARAQDQQAAFNNAGSWLPALIGAFLSHPSGSAFSDDDYAEYAARLKASGAFDPDWYRTTNPDVAESGTDPALHFLQYGLAEGRAPRDLSTPHSPRDAD